MTFRFRQKVLFKHCDPAGIVFYPRYFEMINDCVEAFFDVELGWPFETLLKEGGTPTVTITSTFKAPSRHGDLLDFDLHVKRLGRTSLDLVFSTWCGSELRFETQSTLVYVDGQGHPHPWPEAIAEHIKGLISEHA